MAEGEGKVEGKVEAGMSECPPCALVRLGPSAFDLSVSPLPNGALVTVLRIEHSAGTTVVGVTADTAEALGKQLLDAANDCRKPTLVAPQSGLLVPGG